VSCTSGQSGVVWLAGERPPLRRISFRPQRKVITATTGPMARRTPWLFFVLTFALSWAVWIPTAVAQRPASRAFLTLGAFAPSLVGIALVTWMSTGEQRVDFWKRIVDWRAISSGWYATIILIFPAIMAAGFVVTALTGGPFPPLKSAAGVLGHPALLLGFVVTMFVGGPLAEELGWRGYALDRLQQGWGALGGTLILAAVWILWHLPLFCIRGTSQQLMGLGSVRSLVWAVQLLALTVLITWVFNHTHRSTLAALMVHLSSNATTTLVAGLGTPLPLRFELGRTSVWVLAAVVALVSGLETAGPIPRRVAA